MPEKSRRGIYYRLPESEYRLRFGPIEFYFSSAVYRDKFAERINAEIDIYNYRKTVRTGIRSTAVFTPAFELYKQIEKRGFYAKLYWLGREYVIEKPEDLKIADIPEVVVNG